MLVKIYFWLKAVRKLYKYTANQLITFLKFCFKLQTICSVIMEQRLHNNYHLNMWKNLIKNLN